MEFSPPSSSTTSSFFALTPLLCTGLQARNLDPRPFLFGFAAACNAGSAATLIGNPQNILIGQAGQIGFWSYFVDAAIPSLAGLIVRFAGLTAGRNQILICSSHRGVVGQGMAEPGLLNIT
ncbi:SLC13 family permease [Mesorhizobium sp.]|uniref:SLC13 family permease n=1 Tax=Mesorhizobium sp. TaxID=1871066 RepID=UPI00257DC457|nr:SLC13 family permease [Mesorhizobium sp.]